MEITLIRHLPTQWNEQQILQGTRDIPILPISSSDLKKAKENQQLLQEQNFDLVLCSTLQRTRQTAEAYGFESMAEALLDELDFGPFEGRAKHELFKEHGRAWVDHPSTLMLGESVANLEKRITLFLKKYNHSKHLLVFGHGSWIRALISYHKYGHLNNMNKRSVQNNECISLEFISVGV